MTSRAQKLLAEAKRFMERGEEANWSAAERMWQANKEEGVSHSKIALAVGMHKSSVTRRIALWDRFGAESPRPTFTEAYMELDGREGGIGGIHDRTAISVADKRPEAIVEAITKASPSARKKIMRGIAEEPVLHGEAGSAIVEVAQEWEKDGWDEYKKTSPDAYNFGRWGTAHTHLMHARDRLKLALEELREADISDDEHEGARRRLMKKATECDLLLDWIKSNLESGVRDFDTELGALLGSEDDE